MKAVTALIGSQKWVSGEGSVKDKLLGACASQNFHGINKETHQGLAQHEHGWFLLSTSNGLLNETKQTPFKKKECWGHFK